MDNKEIKDPVKFIEDLHVEIQREWTEINNVNDIDTLTDEFWNRVDLLRHRIRDFSTAFGSLDRRNMVRHWQKLTDNTLLSKIIG